MTKSFESHFQIVSYYADETGYHPKIRYIHSPQHQRLEHRPQEPVVNRRIGLLPPPPTPPQEKVHQKKKKAMTLFRRSQGKKQHFENNFSLGRSLSRTLSAPRRHAVPTINKHHGKKMNGKKTLKWKKNVIKHIAPILRIREFPRAKSLKNVNHRPRQSGNESSSIGKIGFVSGGLSPSPSPFFPRPSPRRRSHAQELRSGSRIEKIKRLQIPLYLAKVWREVQS